MTRAAPRRRNARWAWLAIALVLLMRAAVPQGFMPEQTDDGTIALTICGSGGLVHIPLGKEQHKPESAASHCAFAGMGAPADLPPPLVMPEVRWSGQAFAERREAALRVARLYPRPPSRGPPILA